MYPKQYVGKDISVLLKEIKHDFGDDAIILSNKTHDEGTEIYAISAKDMQTWSEHASEGPKEETKQIQESVPEHFDEKVSLFMKNKYKINEAYTNIVDKDSLPSIPVAVLPTKVESTPIEERSPHINKGGDTTEPQSHLISQLMEEIADMKHSLSAQIADLQWKKTVDHNPAKEAISRLMLQCGYSTKLCKEIISSVPMHLSQQAMYTWLRDMISSRISMHENDSDFLKSGGVYAFLGTTGVGKTTSIAKLAARFVLHHGSESVVLLTTDHYRVCAYDQLRIFGDMLSVPVFSVRSASDLRARLIEYKDKKAILIDTQGIAQKNTGELNELLSLLNQSVSIIKRYLVCSCTSTREHIKEVIEAYQPTSTHFLSGCVLTKLDESVSISSVIDALISARLPISYVSYGLRFPDDFSTPNRQYLLTQALNPVGASSDNLFDRESTKSLMSGTEIAFHSLV